MQDIQCLMWFKIRQRKEKKLHIKKRYGIKQKLAMRYSTQKSMQ